MKSKNPITLLLGSLAFALGPTTATPANAENAAGSSTASSGAERADANTVITGQISNAATETYLEGAVVEIVGTNRRAVTDREGRYLITGVAPSDSVTLSVSFSGLDTQRIPVAIGQGQRVVRDVALNSSIYQMEKFTVAGLREGMAKAEVLQRRAPNVKTVLSSDAFGNFADGNVAEMLGYVAGVTTEWNGPEARGINIRGVGAGLNSVTVDGQTVAQSSSAGTSREFHFDQQSLGSIETIEVTKAPTPDMEGASVGGSVNLVSKSPFDRAGGRVFSYSAGLAFQDEPKVKASRLMEPIPGYGPSASFMFSDFIGEKRKIGITVTGTLSNVRAAIFTLSKQYELKSDPGPVYMNSVGTTFSSVNRTRLANAVNLAYRLSDHTTLMLNTSYNWSHKTDDNPRMTLTAARTLATVDASGNRTGGGPINPSYANGITRVHALPANSVVLNDITSDNAGGGLLIQPMVRHRFPGRLDIDYSFAFSNSFTNIDQSPNNKTGAPPKGTAMFTLNNVGWTADRSQDVVRPTVRQTEGPDWTNLNNYTVTLSQNTIRLREQIYNGRFDLKKQFETALPTYIKTGFGYNQRLRKRVAEAPTYSYTGPDGVLGTGDESRDLDQFADTTSQHLSDKEFRREFHDTGLTAPWPNTYGIARHQTLYPGLWKENPATTLQNKLLSLRNIKESIASAYVMGNIRFGPVSVLTGVRVEETRGKGVGPLTYISPEETARRAAWGSAPVTEAEAVRRAEVQYGNRRTNEGKYDNVFPGVHLKYEPSEGILMRASWSTGIGRPAFGSIIPLDTANDSNQTVTSSNPNLKPQLADSYDVTAEYYFKSGGVFSTGVFRKDITDFIYTDSSYIIPDGPDNGYDGQYAGYRLTTQLNRGKAKVEGFEATFQKQLTFLPGWYKGLGFDANFTALKTEGDYGGTTVTTTGLPNFIPRTFNVGLTYRGHGFDLRLHHNFRGRFLSSANANPALVQWRAPKHFWNIKAKYSISKRLSLFFDVQNILSEQLADIYFAYEDRKSSFFTNPAKYTAGIMGRY